MPGAGSGRNRIACSPLGSGCCITVSCAGGIARRHQRRGLGALLSAGSRSTALSSGATLLRRSGNYDVYGVGSGTFEFSFTP